MVLTRNGVGAKVFDVKSQIMLDDTTFIAIDWAEIELGIKLGLEVPVSSVVAGILAEMKTRLNS